VCLLVCLSVCFYISKVTCPNFKKFSVHVTNAVARSSSDSNAVRCISGFVDDVTFSYNGANWPLSSTTLCFIKFARWQQRGRSLPSPTASRFTGSTDLLFWSSSGLDHASCPPQKSLWVKVTEAYCYRSSDVATVYNQKRRNTEDMHHTLYQNLTHKIIV